MSIRRLTKGFHRVFKLRTFWVAIYTAFDIYVLNIIFLLNLAWNQLISLSRHKADSRFLLDYSSFSDVNLIHVSDVNAGVIEPGYCRYILVKTLLLEASKAEKRGGVAIIS